LNYGNKNFKENIVQYKYSLTQQRTLTNKGKGHPVTRNEGTQREKRYGSTLPLTSVLHVAGGWLTPSPSRFTPGKDTWYPLYKWLSLTGVSQISFSVEKPLK
jgi:hypothetical protein